MESLRHQCTAEFRLRLRTNGRWLAAGLAALIFAVLGTASPALAGVSQCNESGNLGNGNGSQVFTCNDGGGGGGGGGGPGGGSGGGTSYSLWVGYYNCPATLWEQGAYVVLHPEVYGFDEGGIEWEYNVVLCFDASGTIVSQWDYLPIQVNDPAADAAAARDSLLAQLAVRVVAPIPEVAASPPVDATHLVGVWTWFWVDPASYQSLSDTASDPAGLTVTLTAIPHDLRFHPGDGDVVGHDTTVSCPGSRARLAAGARRHRQRLSAPLRLPVEPRGRRHLRRVRRVRLGVRVGGHRLARPVAAGHHGHPRRHHHGVTADAADRYRGSGRHRRLTRRPHLTQTDRGRGRRRPSPRCCSEGRQ